MKYTLNITLLILFLCCRPSVNAGDGLAIAVGLNSVDPAHYGGWSGDLVACENDARDMIAIATANDFKTVSLLTAQATKKAFRQGLNDAASKLVSGDTLVLSYSGHGGQVPDLNGDESDGLDETWCLFDGEIIDDELAELWSNFKDGVRIVVYSDSCHSATVIKNYDLQLKAEVEKIRIRTVPEEIQAKVLALPEYKDFGKEAKSEKDSKSKTKASVISISGCADDQLSRDGDTNGLFTENLLKVWNKGSFSGSYHSFHITIRSKMPADQKPEFDSYGKSNPALEAERPWTK